MPRIVLDRSLEQWEAFATTGAHGLPEPGRVVFRCRSDPKRRSLVVAVEGDKSDAEALVATSDDAELLALLDRAVPLN